MTMGGKNDMVELAEKTGFSRAADQRGFTLLELAVVLLILGVLVAIGSTHFVDLRKRSSDSKAYAEGRHLVTAIHDAFLAGEDVHFGSDLGVELSGDIGLVQSDQSTAREPIFSLSHDVRVMMSGDNTTAIDDFVVLKIKNLNGQQEYAYFFDEETGELSFPSL